MSRMARIAWIGGLAALVPTPALAAQGDVSVGLSSVSGALALILAAGLLVVVVRLRRVAEGSAIAESVGFVVAAVLCLGSAVLVGWIGRFLSEFSAEQARAAADFLVVVSMVLFGVYFARVRRSLLRFLKGSEELLAKMQAADDDWAAGPESDE